MEDRGWQCGMCDYRSLIGILCVAAFYFYCAAGDLSPLLHILEIIFLSFCPFFPSIFFPFTYGAGFRCKCIHIFHKSSHRDFYMCIVSSRDA